MEEISDNVFTDKEKIYTLSNSKRIIYGEQVFSKGNKYFHEWNPYKSKIAAALHRKLKVLNIMKDSIVLYLGCASGTSVSHISDIVSEGVVFAVDKSPTEMSALYLKLQRDNVAPILADARTLQLKIKVDFIIQDIASKDQVNIIINAKEHLSENGEIYFSLKTKSIAYDSVKVLEEAKEKLAKHFQIIKCVNLRGYEANHWLFHMKSL